MQNDIHAVEHRASGGLLRCVTYNIQHGAQGLDKVTRVLTALRPAIVFLQEADKGCARSGCVDQAEVIARALGLHATFAEAFAFESGAYGIALLTPTPVLRHEIIRLPHPSPRREDGSGEPRIALVCRLASLTLVCTHLGLSEDERPDQARMIRQLLDRDSALILGGDLNEGPSGPVARAWSGWLSDAFQETGSAEAGTGPDDRTDVRIDSILRSAGAPAARTALIGPSSASDHRPVIVDFDPVELLP